MKKLLLSISSLIICGFLNAQSPSFQWAKVLPGAHGTKSVAVDAAGNVYSIGISYGGDFDPSSASYTLPLVYGGTYVSKLDASGNFLWAKQFGGDNTSCPTTPKGLDVDAAGNVYITGYFNGAPDFDPSSSTFSITTTMFNDVFIVKLDPAGNFVFAKNFGGSNIEEGEAIKVDASGNIYSTGKFRNTVDFDPGVGTYTLNTIASSFDVYVTKLDASGNFLWAKNFSGGGDEVAAGLSIDAVGNVFVTGGFLFNVDFDPSSAVNTLIPANTGQSDAFIVKLDPSGNLVWAKNMGGTKDVNSTSIKIDNLNNAIVGGYFAGVADFDPSISTNTLSSNGFTDVFIAKLDGSGNFLWAKQVGGPQIDLLFSIALDASNSVFSTGSFMVGADFDPSSSSTTSLTAMHSSHSDAFILKLDASGGFGWARQLGSTNLVGTQGNSLAVDASSNLITGGGLQGPVDFDTEASTYTLTASPGNNFILKMQTGSVGLNEIANADDINIYPNPVSDVLNIDLQMAFGISGNSIIHVTNSLGQIVFSQTVESSKIAINTSNFNKGIYFVSISNGGISRTRKIVVQ